MIQKRKIILVFFLTGLFFWGGLARAGEVMAQGTGSAGREKTEIAKTKIEEEKAELERLKKEIERQKQKRKTAVRKEQTLLGQMEEIDRQRALEKKELSLTNLQLAAKDREIVILEEELVKLRDRIRKNQGRVRERVRVLYQDGRFGSLRVLAGSSDYFDFIKRYYYLSLVSRKEGDLLQNYQKTVAEMLPKEAALKKAREELSSNKITINRNLQRIKIEREKKNQLLAKARTDKKVHLKTIEELEDSRSRIQEILQDLEKKRGFRSKEGSGGFVLQRGFLDWPTNGRVVSRFGRQKHPDFNTTVYRKGIEIQTSEGHPIRSVFDGTVVYADWFRGYGLLVILDHGNDYYSLYAHAAQLLVGPGDRVSRRQVIGKTGDTGLTQKANLYFEIRRGSKPENPLNWLKKR